MVRSLSIWLSAVGSTIASRHNFATARIWINKLLLTTVTPAAFDWGGSFDGATAGSTFGYAHINPKTTGAFYTGVQCAANTWAGPFSLVRVDNSVVTNYLQDQFLEFSVNLSKLGLDPLVNAGDACKMPFRRILVKSRSSNSFSAELKDFVGPFDFFRAPMAAASADIPLFCGTTGISTISVGNPLITSLYTWSTPDGHFASDTIGPSVMVDQPGSYIVRQQLMDSCGSTYASDTVLVTLDPFCSLLQQVDKERKFVFEKNPNKRAVSILPNPVASSLRLSLASPFKESATISLIDISGRELYRARTDVIKSAAVIHIPCPSSWRNGAYFVKVVMGSETITRKMTLAR